MIDAAVDVLEGVRIGFLERQDDGVVVRSVHFRDVLQIGRLKALFIGQYAFERSEHVSARKLCAVMKANAFTELELELRAFHLPGLGQDAAVTALFVICVDQRLHDRSPDSL